MSVLANDEKVQRAPLPDTSYGVESIETVSADQDVIDAVERMEKVIFGGSNVSDRTEVEQGAVPEDVDEATEENDLIVLEAQLSSDELVNNLDILRTEALIEQSREEPETKAQLSLNLFDILKKGAINLILPFINGMMLGFGEILAHEIGFKYNWVGAKVQPVRRIEQKAQRQQQGRFL
ncbi:outer membrane protein TOM13-domain-containing protein [Scheffersomyces xylosifermentans]|uniref:outer membrane protein TOM13-domain-containing protein n=1 Tax=Scheffersomyces xylosifermentans TaxID=1304137 RepID=UPI00315CCCAD